MLEPIRPRLAIVQPVVFVLDGSVSMDWHIGTKSKSNLVRDTLRFIVNYFKSEERRKKEGDFSADYIYIQIIAFDIQPVKYFPDFVRISDLNEDQIPSPTDKIRSTLRRSNKGTRISLGLRSARESIESFIIKNELDLRQIYKTAIILLSDGCTNKEDIKRLEDMSKEINALYNVFVIEFGEPSLRASSRKFHRRSCPETLQKVASQVNPELRRKYKNVARRFELAVNVDEFFINDKLYIRTLDEKHLPVIFITMSTIKKVVA
nr:VWA domain-containing protein [Candidatus Njordarchaeota archaeon]